MIPCIHFDQFADDHHSHRDDLECRARSTSLSAILSQEVCSLPGVDYVQARSEGGGWNIRGSVGSRSVIRSSHVLYQRDLQHIPCCQEYTHRVLLTMLEWFPRGFKFPSFLLLMCVSCRLITSWVGRNCCDVRSGSVAPFQQTESPMLKLTHPSTSSLVSS
jgi:hypothetical protein